MATLQYSFIVKCLFPNIFLNKTLCNYCFSFITNGKNIYKDDRLMAMNFLEIWITSAAVWITYWGNLLPGEISCR